MVVLGGTGEGRVHLVVAATPGAVERGVKAGAVVKVAAQVVGGGGGGRDNMAQAGGRDPEKLPDALAAARAEIERALRREVRVLALDYGARAAASAVSDPTGTLATPLEPVLRPGTRKGVQRIAALARELGAERVVVGLPLSLSGRRLGADRRDARSSPRVWAGSLDIPVELYDERFTTGSPRAARARRPRTRARRRCCWRTGWHRVKVLTVSSDDRTDGIRGPILLAYPLPGRPVAPRHAAAGSRRARTSSRWTSCSSRSSRASSC